MIARQYEAQRRYRERNRELIRARWKKNRRKYLDYYKRKRLENPEWAALENARSKAWAEANKERLREYHRLKQARRMKTNPNHAMTKRLRTRIHMALRGEAKCSSTIELLGCSLADFRIYIESKFEPGMTWENWGKGRDKWNLDHIIPCAIFDLSKPEHQKRCFHFSNYQPLWQTDNIVKGAKVSDEQLAAIVW